MNIHRLLAPLLVATMALSAPIRSAAQAATEHVFYVSDHNLLSSDQSAIVRVDKITGTQTIVAQGGFLSGNDLFGVVMESSTTLLAVDSGMANDPKVIRIDVTTGTQSLVARGIAQIGYSGSAAIGSDGALYLTDVGWLGAPGGIRRIDPVTGAITLVFNGGRPNTLTAHPDGFLYFVGLTVAGGQPGIARLDVATHAVEVFVNGGLLALPSSQIAIDLNGDLLVADFSTAQCRIVRVSHATREMTLLSAGAGGRNLRGLWVDGVGTIFAMDVDRVFVVDRATGTLTPLASGVFKNAVAIAGTPTSAMVGLETTIRSLQAELTAANGRLAELSQENAALQLQVSTLQSSAGAVTNALDDLTSFFKVAFKAPSFELPGTTPSAKIQSLTNAIADLNHGQQQALFKNLGGKK